MPRLGIVLAALLVARGERQDLMIQSRRGYRITVQSAAHTEGDTLQQMMGRLEALHLGEGKTWARKIDSGEMRVAGLPAVTAIYEGGPTRTQIVLMRAADTDLVFMFFASSSNFNELSSDFRWFLERVKTAASTSKGPDPVAKSPLPPASEDTKKWSAFAEPALGYRISYPPGWVLYRVSDNAIVIGGPEGTDAYAATIGVQNVLPARKNDTLDAVATVAADLKRQLAALPQGRLFQEGTYAHVSGGKPLNGTQFTAQFTEGQAMLQQWTVVLPHGGGASAVVHVWSYRAPAVAFEKYRPVAASILTSLALDPAPR